MQINFGKTQFYFILKINYIYKKQIKASIKKLKTGLKLKISIYLQID